MTFTGASLASGQVSDSQADIYAVPSGNIAIIRTMVFYNTGATSETVKVYVKRYGQTARQIGIAVLAQDESKSFAEVHTLSSEDSIQAVTTTASTVDYVLTGAASA